MTDYTIPMIIGMTLAFTLGAGLGGLWGLSRHEWLCCRVTAHLTWRMREAMKSLGIQEWQIDKALEYMGSVIIPPHIPMPEPQVKAAIKREQCQTCLSIAEREQARTEFKAASEREQCDARIDIAEPMEQREPCELAQTWPSRDRGGRSQREQARPQVKPRRDFDKEPYTTDEVVRRLSPHGDRAGEWYCTSRQPRMAWRIDMVDAEGLIVRKLVHDMREHTISKAPETCKPETVEQLAKI